MTFTAGTHSNLQICSENISLHKWEEVKRHFHSNHPRGTASRIFVTYTHVRPTQRVDCWSLQRDLALLGPNFEMVHIAIEKIKHAETNLLKVISYNLINKPQLFTKQMVLEYKTTPPVHLVTIENFENF